MLLMIIRFWTAHKLKDSEWWIVKMDHKRERKPVLWLLAIAFVWLGMKAAWSVWSLPTQEKNNNVSLLLIVSYILCTDCTTILLLHFICIISCVKNRFSNFVINFLRHQSDDENLIKALDGFVCCYSTFESLIERINLIFSLQVIDQLLMEILTASSSSTIVR